jgi:hypothetical protein
MKHRIILLVFLASILTPLIITGIQRGPNLISVFENRKLQQFPRLPTNWEKLKLWPNKFDDYANAQFPGREMGIKFYAASRYRLGSNFHEKFRTGRAGWVFHDHEDNFNQYKGLLNYDSQEVADFADGVAAHQSFFEEYLGIPFLFCATPDKHFLYPEYLPAYMDKYQGAYSNKTICEQALKERNIHYLEIPEKMKSMKKPDELFFQKMGGHWNSIGAFVAYQEMMKALLKHFPGLHILEKEDLQISKKAKLQEYQRRLGAFFESDAYEWETSWTVPRTQTQVGMIYKNEFQAMDSSKIRFKYRTNV